MSNVTKYCEGCLKINAENNCSVYAEPSKVMKWAEQGATEQKPVGLGCAFNLANIVVEKKVEPKKRAGQQKGRRGKKSRK